LSPLTGYKGCKRGKNLSFSALVVVGDENGIVGYGSGKVKKCLKLFGRLSSGRET
jgi:ribosomal protein S5